MNGDEFFKRAYRDPQSPPDIPTDHPTAARIYDYFLGGKDNFECDRLAAEQILALEPAAGLVARENRAFLRRVVRYLVAEAGIRQIIDLGSGLPTQDNVHQVAHRYAPDTRVVYVDNDPIVLAHGRAILAEDERSTVVTADLRDPASVLAHPETTARIDFARPWALLAISVLHFLPDSEDPGGIIAGFCAKMPAGGHLAISHVARVPADPSLVDTVDTVYERAATPLNPRFPTDIAGFFAGCVLLEPGLVPVWEWRAEEEPPAEVRHLGFLGGVGRRSAG